jgi:hypothetical protein
MVSRLKQNRIEIKWENLDKEVYLFDNKDIRISLNELPRESQKLLINGRSIKNLINEKDVFAEGNDVLIRLDDRFGEIRMKMDKEEKVVKVVPRKLFPNNIDEKTAYEFVKKVILTKIGKLLSLVVKNVRDIRQLINLKIVPDDIISYREFVIILLEKLIFQIENLLFKLYKHPIHKEMQTSTSHFGTRLLMNPSTLISPYKIYFKQYHTFETILNKMVFQTLYYIIQESYLMKYTISKYSLEKERKDELYDRLNRIIARSEMLLHKYHLWYFYTEESLDISVILSKLKAQRNPYYFDFYEIYKTLRLIIFSKTIVLLGESKIDFPITKFSTVYELWSVVSLSDYLEALGYKIVTTILNRRYKQRRTKLIFEFTKGKKQKAYLIWEIKLNPKEDSLYYSSLFDGIQITIEEEFLEEMKFEIKPDILLIFEDKSKKTRNIILGDVKFSKQEKLELPKIKDLYKVVGYLVDVSNKSEITRKSKVSGILIYPGFVRYTKIPHMGFYGDKKKIYYIHLVPLNYKSTKIKIK